MFKQMSNRLLSKLDPERYQVLATIPEDPMLWGDRECFLFDNVAESVAPIIDPALELYETYEVYPCCPMIQWHGEMPDGIIEGERHLIALR